MPLPFIRATRFSPTHTGPEMTAVARSGLVVSFPLRLGVSRKASMYASGVQMQRLGSHFFVAEWSGIGNTVRSEWLPFACRLSSPTASTYRGT